MYDTFGLDGTREDDLMLGRSSIESLPAEIIIDVLARLDTYALINVASTSQTMRRVAVQDVLWKPFVLKMANETSPPVHGKHIRALRSSIPLWHPDYAIRTEAADPGFWPSLDEFVSTNEHLTQSKKQAISLDLFPGAKSFHHVYTSFLQKCEPLLGWWASDVPYYGMVIRVILDLRLDETVAPLEAGPAFICQRVHLANRLHGLDSATQQWEDAVGFPMPAGTSVIGHGTILRRSLTQIRTDVGEPGILTEDLWSFCWKEASKSAPRTHPAADNILTQVSGTVTHPLWAHSFDAHEANEPLSEEDLEEAVQVLIEAPRRRALNLGLQHNAFEARHGMDDIRRMLVEPERGSTSGQQRLIYPLSGMVTTRASDETSRHEGLVQARVQPFQPYRDAEQKNAPFSETMMSILPMPPVMFPPPALLSAIRTVPRSPLSMRTIGMSGIQEQLSTHSRYLLDGTDTMLDAMVMDPPPPFRPWPNQTHDLEPSPCFFPICNPLRTSLLPVPRLKRERVSTDDTDRREYEHDDLPPALDPGHVNFDWSTVEGLYTMSYGPHGLELIYVRARALTLLDFGTDDSLPDWPAEPDMSSDDMYDHMRIDRRHASRLGARVLEGIKVLGDPNIPRGQISWRAFIDDPDRSAIRWRPPPAGYRKHTPWPLRAPQAVSPADVRSPGLVLPAHGRVAGEGFAEPGWAPALVCISSIDEIQIWWQPMYKVSIARKIIGA